MLPWAQAAQKAAAAAGEAQAAADARARREAQAVGFQEVRQREGFLVQRIAELAERGRFGLVQQFGLARLAGEQDAALLERLANGAGGERWWA